MTSEAKPGDSGYIIRNYRPEDFEEFVRLLDEAERLDPCGRPVDSRVIAEHLGQPHYSPGKELFLVELNRAVIGYMDMAAEPAIDRVVADCWVHPLHRRKGLAGKLLGHTIKRAGELGVRAVHVNVIEDDVVGRRALFGLGFECVRRYLELELDMNKVSWQDIDRLTLNCDHLQRGEEAQLAEIQNVSFSGSWGYNPNPVDTIIYSVNLVNRSPEDVLLARDGDRVIGYCWTMVTEQGTGRIHMMGTDPSYRGKGVGKNVLLAGLVYLRDKGVRVTELTVDSKNTTACTLYYSIGFEVRTKTLWYEKAVA